jgi:hypothetical protein
MVKGDRAMIPSNQPHSPRRGVLLNGTRRGDPNNAPRCGARTKSRQGQPCKAPAMPNGRCWVHGGPSTGPRTLEGLARSRRARWKHGQRSAGAIAERKHLTALIAVVMGQNKKARETFKNHGGT